MCQNTIIINYLKFKNWREMADDRQCKRFDAYKSTDPSLSRSPDRKTIKKGIDKQILERIKIRSDDKRTIVDHNSG